MHRRTILSLATALASVGVLACTDSGIPAAPAVLESGPQFTASAGVTNLTLVRANAGEIDAGSTYNDLGFVSKLKTHANTDIVVNNNTMTAGGTSGWHTHPAITIVAIKTGALTLYDGGDPLCQPKVFTAGQVFVESGSHVHVARNEGSVLAEWYTTYIVPAGGATRIDAPAPGNCPF
ncbi:MAG TPA: hypothetical protein VF970_16365 [Gemmatimonadales bacterium]